MSKRSTSTSSKVILGVIEDVNIHSITPSLKPVRYNLGGIDVLANSIKQKGLLQPILVRTKEHIFEIVAGNRRYQACKNLGWRKILCHVVELNEKEAFEISMIENVQRKTLSALEEAHAFKTYVSDFGWGGVSELALKLGKSISYVTKRMKLLNLPSDILDSIGNSTLDTSIAEELFSVKNKFKQSEFAQLILKRNLSLRKARHLVRDVNNDLCSSTMNQFFFETTQPDPSETAQRSFDKSIIALKIAMNKLSSIIEDNESNWIIYDTLLQHRNMLNSQIDLLIKQKRKEKSTQLRLLGIPVY
jgi:ParB family transcriptional regulator, chromosome partitioning protein